MTAKKLRPWTFGDSGRIQVDEEGEFYLDGKRMSLFDMASPRDRWIIRAAAAGALIGGISALGMFLLQALDRLAQ